MIESDKTTDNNLTKSEGIVILHISMLTTFANSSTEGNDLAQINELSITEQLSNCQALQIPTCEIVHDLIQ